LNCASLNHGRCTAQTERYTCSPHPGLRKRIAPGESVCNSKWSHRQGLALSRKNPVKGLNEDSRNVRRERGVWFFSGKREFCGAHTNGGSPAPLRPTTAGRKMNSATGIEARFTPMRAFRLSGFHVATRSEARLVGPLRPPSIMSINASLKGFSPASLMIGGLLGPLPLAPVARAMQ